MESTENSLELVIYGAGGIGTAIYGFLAPHYEKVYLLARGENAKAMKSNGLILYEKVNNNPEPIGVKIIESLDERPLADVVVIVTKNYDLEDVAKDISSKLGDKPIIVALQNGVENQKILPKYFTKIIYGILVFGGWRDEPGVFGYRGKGPIFLGTPDNTLQSSIEEISKIFNLGMLTKVTQKLQEAAHSKMIMNLSNSVSTLINIKSLDDSSIPKFRQIIMNVLLEGIQIIEAAGYKEHKLIKLPQWKTIRMANKIPEDMANKMFKESVQGMSHNSMIQDMIFRQKNQSELESLNGYFIKLADSLGLKAPYNNTIYKLCKEQFIHAPYKPLEVDIVLRKINENIEKD